MFRSLHASRLGRLVFFFLTLGLLVAVSPARAGKLTLVFSGNTYGNFAPCPT